MEKKGLRRGTLRSGAILYKGEGRQLGDELGALPEKQRTLLALREGRLFGEGKGTIKRQGEKGVGSF